MRTYKRNAIPILIFVVAGTIGWTGCHRDPQVRRDRYFQEAQDYAQEEKYDEALIQLKNAVRMDPNFTKGHYELGLINRRLGRLRAAQEALRRALELDPQLEGAALELGEIYLIARGPSQARQLAQQILQRDPDNFLARLLVAKSYMAENDFDVAKEEFEKALQLNPDNPGVYSAMGIAEINTKNPVAAEKHLRKALELDPSAAHSYGNLADLYFMLKRFPEAERILQEGIQKATSRISVQLALADFYWKTGRVSDTESIIDSLRNYPKDPARRRRDLGDFWFQRFETSRAVAKYKESLSLEDSDVTRKKLVTSYLVLRETEEASRINQKILENRPEDHEARMFRGAIAYQRGNNQEAIPALEEALSDDPVSVFAHYYMGSAQMAQGNLESAKEHFFECIKYNDKFAHAYLRLGELSLKKNDPEGAAAYARQVLNINPRLLGAYIILIDAALASRDFTEADNALQFVEERFSGNPSVQERRAAYYVRKHDYAKASGELRKALSSSPSPEQTLSRTLGYYARERAFSKALGELQAYMFSAEPNPGLHELAAWLHLAAKNPTAAAEASQKALAIDPKRNFAHIYLGQALGRQGKTDQAVQSFERAIEINPRHTGAYLLLADLHLSGGNLDSALPYYRKAYEWEPNSAMVRIGLARALLESGQDPDWALTLAEQAMQQQPENCIVSDTLAWAYHKKGRNQLAAPLLKECVAKAPKNAIFHFHFGMISKENGKNREANQSLAAALKNGLRDPHKGVAENALKTLP